MANNENPDYPGCDVPASNFAEIFVMAAATGMPPLQNAEGNCS
jgi:hypothetical protein